MMEIKLLGVQGCFTCQNLEISLFNALAELDADARVDKIEDENEIKSYNVTALPGLVINGKVKVSGRPPTKQELINWIKAEM